MKFECPEYLWLFCLIPLLLIISLAWFSYTSRTLKKFYSEVNQNRMVLFQNIRLRNWRLLLFLISLSLAIIALANPQVGTKTEKVKRQGIDLIIALDLSKSMQAEDLKPSRLERAKLFIKSVIKEMSSDRIGLIIFGGNAYVQMPLTVDHGALKMHLNNLSTKNIPTQGTNFTEAIDMAEASFESSSSKNSAILIISDGENHDEEALKKAKAFGEKGHHILTVGVGTEKGAPIPLFNTRGERTQYKKDKNGSIVLSKLNPPFLREIAQAGNGSMVMLADGRSALQDVKLALEEVETKDFEELLFTEYDDQFQFFLLLSCLFLALSFFIPEGNNKERGGLDFLKGLNDEE